MEPGRLATQEPAISLDVAKDDADLKILIVDESPIRAAILEEGLREAGHAKVVHIRETANLLARIYAIDPDVILIDLANPSRDIL
jgi:response regulator NasT